MKLNRDQLLKINDTIKFIINWCDYFADLEDELLFTEERMQEIVEDEEDMDIISIDFPGEIETSDIDVEEFIDLCDEIKSIKIVSNGHIKTDLRSYYIIGATNSNEHDLIVNKHNTEITWNKNKIKINILNESLIVGLVATKLEKYNREYWGTITQYVCIEIIYENKNEVLNSEGELELLNSYFFEVADSTGIAIKFDEIFNPYARSFEITEETEETDYISFGSLRELEPCNDGMKLFVSAVQIADEELKFLNFYKILEHFSPIAVNIEANELMRKKLDAPKSSFENGDYIRSIFELANSVRLRFNDEDLIKSALNTCIDFVGLYRFLPDSIKKKIRKQIEGKELSYSIDKQKIISSCNIAGKIIYKTRNKVVHAKSNYVFTGEEIEFHEFLQLNKFMKQATSQAIRWYTRLPNHLKLDIIK